MLSLPLIKPITGSEVAHGWSWSAQSLAAAGFAGGTAHPEVGGGGNGERQVETSSEYTSSLIVGCSKRASPLPVQHLEISVESSFKWDYSNSNLSSPPQRQLDGDTHPGCR